MTTVFRQCRFLTLDDLSGCDVMVACYLAKVVVWVRFPPPALETIMKLPQFIGYVFINGLKKPQGINDVRWKAMVMWMEVRKKLGEPLIYGMRFQAPVAQR